MEICLHSNQSIYKGNFEKLFVALEALIPNNRLYRALEIMVDIIIIVCFVRYEEHYLPDVVINLHVSHSVNNSLPDQISKQTNYNAQ